VIDARHGLAESGNELGNEPLVSFPAASNPNPTPNHSSAEAIGEECHLDDHSDFQLGDDVTFELPASNAVPAAGISDSNDTQDPVYYSEFGFDDEVPCLDIPEEMAFTFKLFIMLTRKDIPRGLFSKVIKLINSAMASGILHQKQTSFPVTRDATFNRMKELFPFPKHESVPITLESYGNKYGTIDLDTTLRDRPVVQRFPFKDVLLDLLKDRNLFGDINNLVVNPDDPFGVMRQETTATQTGDKAFLLNDSDAGSLMRDMHTELKYDPDKGDLIVPLVFYMDQTGTTSNMRWGVEPLLFAVSWLKRSMRNKRDGRAWRVLGYMPDFLRSKAAKAQSSQTADGRGRAARNYHLALDALLKSVAEANEHFKTNKQMVRLGKCVKKVTLRLVLHYLMGDGKSQDQNTGRMAGYNTKRLCRACDVKWTDSSNTVRECTWITKKQVSKHLDVWFDSDANDRIDKLTKRNESYFLSISANEKKILDDLKSLKKAAGNELDALSTSRTTNAWFQLQCIDPSTHIFGCTPSDVTHFYLLGILPYVVRIHQSPMTNSVLASIDSIVDRSLRTNKSSEARNFFTTSYARGITNVAMNTADEWAGVVFTHLMIALLPSGEKAMDPAFVRLRSPAYNKNHNGKTKSDKNDETEEEIPKSSLDKDSFVKMMEDLLTFHEWMKRSESLPMNSRLEKKYLSRVKVLVEDIKKCFPREAGNGWNIQKLHETMHVVRDTVRFGLPQNFDAGIGELLLQHFAKHPASTSKCVTQIQFQESIAIRNREFETMRKAAAHMDTNDEEDNEDEEDDILMSSSRRESLITNSLNEEATNEEDNANLEVIRDVDESSQIVQNDEDVNDDEDDDAIDESIEDSNHIAISENSSKTNTYKPLTKQWDWKLEFRGNMNLPILTMKKYSKRKTKASLHPVIFNALRKQYESTTTTLYGCFAFQKTWKTNDDTEMKVVFRCDPNHQSLGKNWYDWAMVRFNNTDHNQVPEDESLDDFTMPPGRFPREYFPCKILAFFRDSSENKYRLVVHPCDYNDHGKDSRLVEKWNLHYEVKNFDVPDPKANDEDRANGKTIKEKRLVPQVTIEEEDVLDERTHCIEEMPTVQETIKETDLNNGRHSTTVLYVRDRKHWPTLFVDDK